MDITNFNEDELLTILRFTKQVADGQRKDLKANFNYDYPSSSIPASIPDSEDLERSREQAKELIEARKAGRTGRIIDRTPEDKETRSRVRSWLEKTNRIKKYK